MKRRVKIQFVDFWSTYSMFHHFILDILKGKYEIVISSNPDFLFYSCYGEDHKKFSCIKIFYTGENLRPNFYDCEFSMSFDYNDFGGRNFRLPLFLLYNKPDALIKKDSFVSDVFDSDRRFCNMVVSNAEAKERIEFFNQLSKYKKVDSGGRCLNNIGGPVVDKMEFIKKYKFTIAFENSSSLGYTSEKIMQPMLAGSIPIYWGNPKIESDFNVKSFVNIHNFPDYKSAIAHILEIDTSPDLYQKYLREPFFTNNAVPDEFLDSSVLKFLEFIFEGNYKIDRLQMGLRPMMYSMKKVKSKLGLVIYKALKKK